MSAGTRRNDSGSQNLEADRTHFEIQRTRMEIGRQTCRENRRLHQSNGERLRLAEHHGLDRDGRERKSRKIKDARDGEDGVGHGDGGHARGAEQFKNMSARSHNTSGVAVSRHQRLHH
eukprot:3714806-Heterocapsa_arctica.AAC.1